MAKTTTKYMFAGHTARGDPNKWYTLAPFEQTGIEIQQMKIYRLR